MWNATKLVALGLITLGAAIAANFGRDLAYQVHAIIILAVAGGLFIWTLRRTGEDQRSLPVAREYMDDVVRAGAIATAFWGVVGFLVGTFHRLSALVFRH